MVVGLYEGRPVNVQIPKKIKYKVVEAPPAVRGDSATGNVTKEITLDNGLKIQAPIFIKEGEEIIKQLILEGEVFELFPGRLKVLQ